MAHPTTTSTAPNAARGEVSITIGGEKYPIRFSLNVLRDWGKLTQRAPSEFGQALSDDYLEALTGLICCAVRRYVPGAVQPTQFTQDDAGDLIEGFTDEEKDAVADAITESVSIPPLMAALMAKVTAKNEALAAQTPPASGTSSSTSDSAS